MTWRKHIWSNEQTQECLNCTHTCNHPGREYWEKGGQSEVLEEYLPTLSQVQGKGPPRKEMELKWPRRKIVHGKYRSYRKPAYRGMASGVRTETCTAGMSTLGGYQLWPYHGQFQCSVGGRRSQTERGRGVMRKWQKELSRGCSSEETVTRERQDRARGRERTAWEDYFSNWVCFYAKGEHKAEKRLKILKSKVIVNGKGPEREFSSSN